MELDELPQPEYEGHIDIDELSVDGDNPNEQSSETFGLLVDRMEERGWLGGPIITDADGLIADGEHRYRAADELGLGEVPVKKFDITDEERRMVRQELNKIAGEHDTKRDALEYDLLMNAGMSEEVDELTTAAGEDLDEVLDEIREVSEATVPYQYDPDHNIHFEECAAGMADKLDAESVDTVITDPPYGVDVDLSNTMGSVGVSHKGSVDNDGFEEVLRAFEGAAEEMARVIKPDGHAYVFASWKTYDAFRDILIDNGFQVRNCIVWLKTTPNYQPTFGAGKTYYGMQHEFILFAVKEDGDPRALDRVMSDLLLHKHMTQDNEHPTQKPVELLEKLVEQSSSPGDMVLDPFMGSGSTAVAAIKNERNYVGFEMDEENYRSLIERRIGEAKRQVEGDDGSDDESDEDDEAAAGGTDDAESESAEADD